MYHRGGIGFGAAPPQEPRLDPLILRNPRPSDESLFEALQRAEEQLSARKQANPAREEAQSAAFAGADFGVVDKIVPLFGIGMVAIVLLLVAGAMSCCVPGERYQERHSLRHQRNEPLNGRPR